MGLPLRAYQALMAASLVQTPHHIRDSQHFWLNDRNMQALLTQRGQRTGQDSIVAQSIEC